MFVKELDLYIDYLKNQIDEITVAIDKKQARYFDKFAKNLSEGIAYYDDLVERAKCKLTETKSVVKSDLAKSKAKLDDLFTKISNFTLAE
jgi:hypothetical protein